MRVLLSLFLCFSLCIPSFAAEVDPNEYYTYSSIGDYGIMPLDLTSQQDTWLKGIYDRLYYGNQSAAWFLNQIYTYIGHNPALGSLQSLSNDIKNYIGSTNDRLIYNNTSAAQFLSIISSRLYYDGASLAYWSARSSNYLQDYIGPALSDIAGQLKSSGPINSTLSEISSRLFYKDGSATFYLYYLSSLFSGNLLPTLNQILEKIEAGNAKGWPHYSVAFMLDPSGRDAEVSAPPGVPDIIGSGFRGLGSLLRDLNAKEWPTVSGSIGYWSDGSLVNVTDYPFSDAVRSMLWNILNGVYSPFSGDASLSVSGEYVPWSSASSSTRRLMEVLNTDLVGLAVRLSGVDRQTAFSFLAEDITQPAVSVTADNLLDALGIMGTQLQNPLQRLAYVFANPQDLEMRENVSDNTDEANEQFFKPGSAGSVSPGNIKDAASMTSAASDFLDTGATASDAFSGLSGSTGLWGFFSQAAMEDMLGNPPPVTHSLGELDEEGFYSPSSYHLQQVDEFLGKGG